MIRFCYLLLGFFAMQLAAKSQGINDGIFYSSLNYAIQRGQFDGVATVSELKKHGNFGVGSRHGLAGELVLLNGKAYHISVDGKAKIMPDSAKLPFAAAKFFKAEKKMTLNKAYNLQQLQSYLDSAINTNLFAAIKISGTFALIKYKCYYPQHKPYKPINETPAKFFDSTNIRGTIVGFFTPKSAVVLNSPNYHFHFINALAGSGGHVDDCVVENITIEVDYANELQVKLPLKETLTDIDLNQPVTE